MKKQKLKTYQVTQVIYVTMEVKAKDEEHAEEKMRMIVNAFDEMPDNEPLYQKALAQAEYEIKNIEAVEVEDDRKPDRKGRLN
jgi:hypothetical protein